MNFVPSDLDSPTTMGAEQAVSSSAAGTALRPSFSKFRMETADCRIDLVWQPFCIPHSAFRTEDFPPSDLDYLTTMGAEHAVSSAAAGTALRPSFSKFRMEIADCRIDPACPPFCIPHSAFRTEDFPPSDLDYLTTMGAEQAVSSAAAGTALRPSFSKFRMEIAECRIDPVWQPFCIPHSAFRTEDGA